MWFVIRSAEEEEDAEMKDDTEKEGEAKDRAEKEEDSENKMEKPVSWFRGAGREYFGWSLLGINTGFFGLGRSSFPVFFWTIFVLTSDLFR